MNTYPYDAVVFDLDGTLCDAEDGIISSALYTMEQLGQPVPEGADLRAMVGPPLRDAFSRIFGLPDAIVDQAVPLYRDRFNKCGMFHYALYPHIRSMLQMLHRDGVFVAAASSKTRDILMNVLDFFHISQYFDRIIGELSVNEQLGKPELIRLALPEHYHHAAMIGDRYYDIEGALANQIDAIGVSYGCGSEQELQYAGATHIVPDTEALCALLCPGGKIPRGFFLSVEGPDGSGKTTQADLLEKRLKQYGYSVLRTREPGGCQISEDIRAIILDTKNIEMCAECEALLYAAARAQHVHQVIRPAVERGLFILCDRFVDSSIAYQGGGREMGVELVREMNEPAVGDMMPDATVYLAIDHEAAMARRMAASTPDRLELEIGEFHERVQKAYEQMIRDNKKRFLVIDASRDAESISEDVFRAVLSRVED